MQIRYVLTVLATAMLLSACGDSEIRGGPVRSETRTVGAFNSIEVEGATRLEITVGVPVSLVLEGRDPFLQRLETEVRGDKLHIKSQRKDWVSIGTSPRLTIRIGVPSLLNLELKGGNDVRLAGFAGGATTVHVEGATNLHGSGRLDELTINVAGAAKADLSNLVANAAHVTVSGVGSVYVHSQESLDATMNGVGAIFYSGSPRHVNTRMNGLGTIGQRDHSANKAPAEDEPIDPESLQPEYDRAEKPRVNRQEKPQETTEVI